MGFQWFMGPFLCWMYLKKHEYTVVFSIISRDGDGKVSLNFSSKMTRTYLSRTQSIPSLLMPWCLTSPGHKQPWYWASSHGIFCFQTTDGHWGLRKIAHILLTTFFNTLRPRRNGHHFADDIFKCIFLNENISISIKISLQFVPKCPINNIPVLVQIMARRCSGDKPLSKPMMVSLPTHMRHPASMS